VCQHSIGFFYAVLGYLLDNSNEIGHLGQVDIISLCHFHTLLYTALISLMYAQMYTYFAVNASIKYDKNGDDYESIP
jgi:hypothetical protein